MTERELLEIAQAMIAGKAERIDALEAALAESLMDTERDAITIGQYWQRILELEGLIAEIHESTKDP